MKPIIGQEAVVSGYGLGRVISFSADERDIEVRPYICGYSMVFDKNNVRLVEINYAEQASENSNSQS